MVKINSGKSLPPMRIGLATLRLWHLLCLQSHASSLTLLIRLRLQRSFLVRLYCFYLNHPSPKVNCASTNEVKCPSINTYQVGSVVKA